MKFKIKVKEKNTDHEPWWEKYDTEKNRNINLVNIEEAKIWAERMITKSNMSLLVQEGHSYQKELLDVQEIIEPRKEIMELAIEMELRLRKFDNDKGICGWKDKGFRHLFRKIDRNLLKAENVIFNNILNNSFSNKKKCKKDTIKQLVDAANYIVMILDNLKEK